MGPRVAEALQGVRPARASRAARRAAPGEAGGQQPSESYGQ